MLKCKLALLLAERGLKISKVSKDTGISRTTLTALANNTSQGVQLETIDKLCLYLKIDVSSFFVFHPSSLSYEIVTYDDDIYVSLSIMQERQIHKVLLETFVRSITVNSKPVYSVELFLAMLKNINDLGIDDGDEYDMGNEWFHEYYPKLPIIFKSDFESCLLKDLIEKLNIPKDSETILNIESSY